MSVVDVLTTRVDLDSRGYQAGAATVQATTAAMSTKSEQFANGLKMSTPIVAAFTGAILAGVTAMVALGTAAFRQAAQFDALVKALEAVEGSASKAKSQFEDLRQLAKLPGLGFEEAIGAYLKMRGSGLTEAFSERAIGAFGAANARVGGGPEEFARIMSVVSQIASKPFLQGEELLQFSEANLAVRPMLQSRFGTSDTEALKRLGVTSEQVLAGLVEDLEGLGKPADSLRNTLDNLNDVTKLALASIGEGLAGTIGPALASISAELEKFVESGGLRDFGDALGIAFEAMTSPGTGGKDTRTIMLDVYEALVTGFAAVRNAVTQLGDIVKFLIPPAGRLILEQMAKDSLSPQAEGRRARDLLEARLALAEKRAANAAAKGEPMAEDAPSSVFEPGKSPGSVSNASRAVAALEAIQDNTARALDIQRTILGGGDLGRFGVTQVDLSGMRRRRTSFARVLVGAVSPVMIGLVTEAGG